MVLLKNNRRGEGRRNSNNNTATHKIKWIITSALLGAVIIFLSSYNSIGLSVMQPTYMDLLGIDPNNEHQPTNKKNVTPTPTIAEESLSSSPGEKADNNYVYPKPRLTNSSVVIYVLSRREAYKTRQVIRQTWAHKQDNVYFVLSAACPIPNWARNDFNTCEWADFAYNNKTAQQLVIQQDTTKFIQKQIQTETNIRNEMEVSHDVILFEDLIDTYRGLTAKVKASLVWATTNLPHAVWFIKADDDMYLRVPELVDSTITEPGPYKNNYDQMLNYKIHRSFKRSSPHLKSPPRFIDPRNDFIVSSGHMVSGNKVQRHGKWKEYDEYKPTKYPNFPGGDGGHMISRGFAQYITNHSDELFNYQGEDVSIGIWADESPHDVYMFKDKRMTAGGPDCRKIKRYYLSGHNFSPGTIKKCDKRRPNKRNITTASSS